MISFLHLADLHLGWQPAYLPDDKKQVRQKERDLLLQKAVDFALDSKNEIQAVLIAGDLFESYKPDPPLVRHVLDQLGRLVQAGLFLVTVPGNHDEITYRESVYRTAAADWPGLLVQNPLPQHVHTVRIKDADIHVYSLAYTGGLTRPSAIKELERLPEPGFHLGVFHGSLDWPGQPDRSLPLSSADLKQTGLSYLALGHYHKYSQTALGSGLAVYPGAAEFKSFADPGTGQLVVCSWDGTRVRLVQREIDRRPNLELELDVTDCQGQEELQERCQALAGKEAMLRLALTGTPGFAPDLDLLADELEGHFFHLELAGRTSYFSPAQLDRISREATIRGSFVRRLQEKIANSSSQQQKVYQAALLEGLAALAGEGEESGR